LRGAQTYALRLFAAFNLPVTRMASKVDRDLDILKTYSMPNANDEAFGLRHSKVRAWIEKNTKKA